MKKPRNKKFSVKIADLLILLGQIAIVILIEIGSSSDTPVTPIEIIFLIIVSTSFAILFAKKYLDEIDDFPKNEYRKYLLKELGESDAIQRFEEKDTILETIHIDPKNKIELADKNANEIPEYLLLKRSQADKKDILALMLKNNDEITEYFTISKRHAKSSYYFSVITCIAGLIMLGIAIYGAVFVNNIQLTIIGTAGGAITEVISGTVLWIHNKSALQLNYYYDALHENEKFLSAINIADKLNNDKRDEMYMEIIRRQIEPKVEKTS